MFQPRSAGGGGGGGRAMARRGTGGGSMKLLISNLDFGVSTDDIKVCCCPDWVL